MYSLSVTEAKNIILVCTKQIANVYIMCVVKVLPFRQYFVSFVIEYIRK